MFPGKKPVKHLVVIVQPASKTATSKIFKSSFLKYFFIWMKIISGISLDYPESNGGGRKKGKYLIILFVIFSVLINGAVSGSYIFSEFSYAYTEDTGYSISQHFTILMDSIIWSIYSVGVHVTFLFSFIIGRWKKLCKCLVKIEKQMYLDDDFYRHIRKLVMMGFFKILYV